MERIAIAVCDDEKVALNAIAGAVSSIFEEKGIQADIHRFASSKKMLEYFHQNPLDLVYLDLYLPNDMNGLALGKALSEVDTPPDVIFVTSKEDKVFTALKVHPFGFVRKSHLLSDISDVTRHWIATQEKRRTEMKIIVQTDSGCINVPTSSIRYFEGDGSYQKMWVEHREKPVRISSRMKILEDKLKPEGVLRVHKGYLVNYLYIDRITGTAIFLIGDEEIPISRGKGAEIKSEYLALCRKGGSMSI
ncbi:MAG: LytTR family transcriptional regulator DNA-binding domain-containing protein [Clostridiales bacterium]|nr:LytTR family transcriptional regulator DNA-binding domain-containing protein [Clostridiales bacterium]